MKAMSAEITGNSVKVAMLIIALHSTLVSTLKVRAS
jgi:hypothetical protein